MSIPREFIDQLIDRTDIVDLISPVVSLKKKGVNYLACCPFHAEKSPSFSVSQTKQFYYCFGCGAHGNSLDFLMNYHRLSFVDAVEELASRQGLTVPAEAFKKLSSSAGSQEAKTRDALFAQLKLAEKFFESELKKSPQAINYLKARGISGKIAKAFCLGFAPASWDGLTRALAKSPQDFPLLCEAGLVIQSKEGRHYDRFRNRVMFPIHDSRGRTVGFGGRVIEAHDQPKYLNSPETPVFHKGETLYGLYEVHQHFHHHDPGLAQLLVVEGYMDVVGLAQKELNYAVATLGTATTTEHIRLMLRHTRQLIFCFDGDRAGRAAAWRALKAVLPSMAGETQARFLFLPDNEDPDSLIGKEGKAAFEARFEGALSLTQFLIQGLSHRLNLKTVEGAATFLSRLKPYLALLPEGPYASMLNVEVGRLLNLSLERLKEMLHPETFQLPTKRSPSLNIRLGLVEKAIVYLLHQPTLIKAIAHPKLANNLPGAELLNELITLLSQINAPHVGSILQQWKNPATLPNLAQLAALEASSFPEDLAAELTGIYQKILQQHQHQALDSLLEKAKQQTLSPVEKQELSRLLLRG